MDEIGLLSALNYEVRTKTVHKSGKCKKQSIDRNEDKQLKIAWKAAIEKVIKTAWTKRKETRMEKQQGKSENSLTKKIALY